MTDARGLLVLPAVEMFGGELERHRSTADALAGKSLDGWGGPRVAGGLVPMTVPNLAAASVVHTLAPEQQALCADECVTCGEVFRARTVAWARAGEVLR